MSVTQCVIGQGAPLILSERAYYIHVNGTAATQGLHNFCAASAYSVVTQCTLHRILYKVLLLYDTHYSYIATPSDGNLSIYNVLVYKVYITFSIINLYTYGLSL